MKRITQVQFLMAMCAVLSILGMTGCASFGQPSQRAYFEEIKLSSSDTQLCSALPELTSRRAEVLTPWIVSTVEEYNECAKRVDVLVEKIQKYNQQAKTIKGSTP